MTSLPIKHTVLERFLRYVVIDTQSDPASPTCPSTEKQKDLGRLLVRELHDIGLADAHLDEHGYVYATIPANTAKKVPVICFCSHMDTSPDCTGANVKPQIVQELPGRRHRAAGRRDPGHPRRRASGAGRRRSATTSSPPTAPPCSAPTTRPASPRSWMRRIPDRQPADQARHHQDPVHARRRDRPRRRQGRPEASSAPISPTPSTARPPATSRTRPSRPMARPSPSTASARIPALPRARWNTRSRSRRAIIDALPKDTCSPETTEGREGFLHPTGISGTLDRRRVKFIVRDFTEQGLREKEALLRGHHRRRDEGLSALDLHARRSSEQYRNMKEVVDQHPEIVDNAHGSDPPRRSEAGPLAASAAAPTARGCRSWACPAPTSSPANTPSTRGWNGSACRTCRPRCAPSCIWR